MSHLPSRHRREINLSILTPSVISLDGSEDGVAEAAGYEKKLRALSKRILPRDNNVGGFPMIDLALIGVAMMDILARSIPIAMKLILLLVHGWYHRIERIRRVYHYDSR